MSRLRYKPNIEIVLTARDGSSFVVESVTLKPLEGAESVGAIGESSFFPSEEQQKLDIDDRPHSPSESDDPGRSKAVAPQAVVQEVWDHYCKLMSPRSVNLGPEESKLIRDALRAAHGETWDERASEVKRAISGCYESPFHMGKNDRGKKYNKLGQILKARRGHTETTRDRLDFFIDIYEKSGKATSEVRHEMSGVMRDRVVRRRLQVVEMYRSPDNPALQATGREALAWLREHAKEEPEVKAGQVTGWRRIA